MGVLLVLIALGVRDVVRDIGGGSRQPAGPPPAPSAASEFPALQADAYATQFALAYLTYDSDAPQSREQALAPFLPRGADPQLGWDGSGKQMATLGIPSSIDVRAGGMAEVTVAVLTDRHQWMYLAVPVVTEQGRLLVPAPPALVPRPGRADPPQAVVVGAEDTTLEQQLQPNLAAFFAAWAAGDGTQLSYFEASGANLQGLGGTVQFVNVATLRISADGGNTRSAQVSVNWRDASTRATVTQTYQLTLTQESGQWHVRQIEPAGV